MNISIRLPDQIVAKADMLASCSHITRAQYIKEAIELYNRIQSEEALRKKLAEASYKVREASMLVNKDFEEIEHDL